MYASGLRLSAERQSDQTPRPAGFSRLASLCGVARRPPSWFVPRFPLGWGRPLIRREWRAGPDLVKFFCSDDDPPHELGKIQIIQRGTTSSFRGCCCSLPLDPPAPERASRLRIVRIMYKARYRVLCTTRKERRPAAAMAWFVLICARLVAIQGPTRQGPDSVRSSGPRLLHGYTAILFKLFVNWILSCGIIAFQLPCEMLSILNR
jgi:hypothetical protein